MRLFSWGGGEEDDPARVGDEESLKKLMEIIHFTEEILIKITPFQDEKTIYHTLVEEARRSGKYGLTILRLTDDRSGLSIVETAFNKNLIRAAEKLAGVKMEDFTIDHTSSDIFQRVVLDGETIQEEYSKIVEESISSRPSLKGILGQILNILRVKDKYNILTPLRSCGEIVGVLEISSTDLGELFIPTVKTFGIHISNILDLSREHSEGLVTKRALAENEELHENIFTHLEDGIFILDSEFRHTYWNRAMERFSGKKMEEVVGSGKTAWEIFPDLPQHGLEESMRRAMDGDVVSMGDVPYRTDGGEEGYTSVIMVPLRTSTEDIRGIVGLVREITEQKMTRENLRISETKYRFLVENANEAIVVARSGKITFANPKASEITGYTSAELDQKPITELIHPDDIDMVMDRHRRRTRGEEVQNVYVFRIIDREGNTKWVEINAVSFNWEGEQSTLNFLTDVSERIKAEEALIESQEKWRSWVENAPDRITTLDENGNILYVNNVPPGFRREEVLGNSVYDHMERDERANLRRAIEKAFGYGRVTRYESTFVGADGSRIFFENSVGPVKKGSNVVSAILISRDITERKQAEEALRKSEERLQTLFEIMAEGVIVLNSEGRIVEANYAAERILGVDRSRIKNSDYIGPEWEAIRVDGSSMPLSEIPSAVAMREKRPVRSVVMGIKRVNAPVTWLSVSAVPFTTEAGKQTGVVTTFSDITKWKKIKGELVNKTRYFERILEASPGAIAVTDESGTIVECNQALMDLHGFNSRNQILGKTVFSLTPSREHERLKMGFKQVVESGSVRVSPLSLLDAAGDEVQVDLTGSIVKDPTGSPGRFIAILRKMEDGVICPRPEDKQVDVEA